MKKIILLLFIIAVINQTYSQSNINPDISLIGTFNTFTNFIDGSAEKGKLNFDNPEMELFIDGYLNPYARATADIAYEEGEFGLEELYAQILRGLPFDIQLKAGKYLTGFGKINTIHPHAWPFLERPLFHQVYFGEGGFNDVGFNINFILPSETFYSSIELGLFKGDAIARTVADDPEDSDSFTALRGKSPIFVGRFNSFFQLGEFSDLEIGLSGSYGVHSFDYLTSASRKSLYYTYTGLDFKYKYRPNSYSSLLIQGEALLNNRDVIRSINGEIFVNDKISSLGAFIYFDYQFAKQFSLGAKYDFTYGIVGDVPGIASLSNDDQNKTQGISGWFGYYPVEETLSVRLGVENLFFNYADNTSRDSETTIKLQMIFSLGPHKAHQF